MSLFQTYTKALVGQPDSTSTSATVDAAGVLTAMQGMNATQEAQARDAIQAAPVVNLLALEDADFTSNNLDLTSAHENMLLDLSAVTVPVTLTWQTDAAGGYTTTGPVSITVYNGGTAPAALIAGSGATLVGGPQVIEHGGGWGGLYRTGTNEATCEGNTRTALPLGPALLSGGFSLIVPNGAATAGVTALGINTVGNTLDSSVAAGAGGTDGTAPFYNRARNQYNSAAAAINRSTGFNSAVINADNDAAGGRYPMTIAGAIADAIATAPFYMGIVNTASFTTAISSTEPSALTTASEGICIGADSADANLSLYYNDNAGTPTKIALGADFPKSQYVLYELTVFKNDAGTGYLALVRNVNTGAATAIPIVSNIPRTTVTMQFVLARSSWASATTASVQFAYQCTGFRP